MSQIIKKIYDYSLEDILGERFGRYSKSIIQDRALPDVRDGLKPVQRRILYSMHRNKNTFDKSYQKSARAIGDVMGKYHPHGDSSIYEAMVRMSQWWKQSTPLIDMHGNNGSIDGDSPAAMRYTEARLSKIANELLKDIDKETVLWAPNYDDTLNEPTVLPAKFPNLLVNGSSGISSGYATNIPPHNLGEVIDATIKRIDSPNCHLETLLAIIKGPDFPTGGTVYSGAGIKNAFATGRGKVIHQANYEITAKKQIIVSEIPFEVNKASLVKKIDEIRIDKKIEGIIEVRDESDLGALMRIVIDLKKDCDPQLVMNYLLKNTELQVAYHYNMVAIVNKRPVLVDLMAILDAYIKHQKEVISLRSEFDLRFAEKQLHIAEGLKKAISILDDVIKTIRQSKDKSDAKINLQNKYDFSEKQADAIVTLQLYRLTNTDIIQLEEEITKLAKIISGLKAILADEELLKSVLKEELRKLKKAYLTPRKSVLVNEEVTIKINEKALISKEEVVVVLSKEGYLKRVSKRSFAHAQEATALKAGDFPLLVKNASTLDVLLVFTNLGNYLYIPIHEITECKWRDLGKNISSKFKLAENEIIINALVVNDFLENKQLVFLTKKGMIKQTKLSEFKALRYSKAITNIKLKTNDQVIFADQNNNANIFIATKRGYGLYFDLNDVPVTGLKTAGVKAISLKDDEVVSAVLINHEEFIAVFTNKSTGKRLKISEIKMANRARRGNKIIREVITNPYYVVKVLGVNGRDEIGLKSNDEIISIKSATIPITDSLSTGRHLTKKAIFDAFISEINEESANNV